MPTMDELFDGSDAHLIELREWERWIKAKNFGQSLAASWAWDAWLARASRADAEIERLREHAVVLAATVEEVERERCVQIGAQMRHCALLADWHTFDRLLRELSGPN